MAVNNPAAPVGMHVEAAAVGADSTCTHTACRLRNMHRLQQLCVAFVVLLDLAV